MPDLTIDEALDLAITLLEQGATGEVEQLASWVVDNLVHVLDEWQADHASKCQVAGYEVFRIMEDTVIRAIPGKGLILDAERCRMLAAALLRAAEASDQED